MNKRHKTAGTPSPVLESYCNVAEDCNKSNDNCNHSISLYVICNCRTNLVGADDTVRVIYCRGKLLKCHLLSKATLKSIVEFALNLFVNLCRVVCNLVLCSNLHLACATKLLNLNSLSKLVICKLTNLLRCNILVEAEN